MEQWVLLRGLVRESRHWGAFPECLAQTLPNAHLTLLDLAGNGLRNQERSACAVAAMVQDCRLQLRQRGLAPPYRLLALSMGAMVAAHWSVHYPQEISHQVLINTSMRPFSPFYQRLRPRHYLPLLRLGLGQASAARWENAILKMTSCRTDSPIAQEWQALRERNPVATANALRQLWAALRFRAARQAPTAATLVLSSAGDQLVHPACSEALARHWHAPLCLHPSAGHDLPLDDGAWVAQQIAHWLQHQLPVEPA